MKTQTLDCIILGNINLSDKDKMVFLYNEELGKLKTIAKGARSITSKFTGHLETFNFCTVNLYFGPKNIILTDISTNKTHFHNRNNLNTISSALQMAEITNKVIYENQQIDGFMELLTQTLEHLEKTEKKTLILTAYIIKILDMIGLIPDLKETKVSLEEKYTKFFNFIKEKSFTEIESISLSNSEKEKILSTTNTIIENTIGTAPKFSSI